jgi:cytosine/adenosine deaminase-related metal-dependent hydrolase
MPLYRAAWLLPVSQPPIRDAWLRTDRGRIVAFGPTRPGDFTASDEIDLGNVAVLPGLVNAHTHLELSWMRGRIGRPAEFSDWLRSVMALRSSTDTTNEERARAIPAAIAEARAYGTALVGDISNTLRTSADLSAAEMAAVVFYELFGFNAAEADRIINDATDVLQKMPVSADVRHTIAPHAPYSVSPALFGRIRVALNKEPFARSSVHLGESEAEIEFLRRGTGPYRRLLEDIGKWDPSWTPPGCSPVEYIDQMGFLDDRLLVVHGVHFGAIDLDRIAAKRATIVTCPRGNSATGAGASPVGEFFESDVRIAVGTDSLASVPDLNLFAELAEMRRLAPEVAARRLLEAATINGARALGFESEFGSIDSGKRAAVIAVELDGAALTVEEQLVSGIDRSRIRWVTES